MNSTYDWLRGQDRTPLEHAGLALIAQLAIGLSTGDWWLGAGFGVGYFLGREIAQHDCKLWRWGEPRTPWYRSLFEPWTRDSLLDFIAPSVAVLLLALWMS